jgi:hypothetical protein
VKNMSVRVLKTGWFPEYGRAFVLSSIDALPNGERGGEFFVVTFDPQGKVSGHEQVLFEFKLPDNLFSDENLFDQMAYLAEARIHLEVDKLLLKSGNSGYAKKFSVGMQSSSLADFVVALLLGDQKNLLTKIEDESRSESLSTELAPFVALHGCFAKKI